MFNKKYYLHRIVDITEKYVTKLVGTENCFSLKRNHQNHNLNDDTTEKKGEKDKPWY